MGPRAGEVLGGRYELVDHLASGGAGAVWRVWDRRRGEYVAAKLLQHADSDSVLRFVREARRVVDHPAVVGPSGWAAEDDRVLLTMELVRGGSVATLLADHGALPEGWALELARQAADVLAAVHDAGYAHRDVKPGNLLLDATGRGRPRLRLSDFGAAVAFDEPRLTSTGAVLGTPGYLPPEAWSGADPAPTHDVYALGVVLGQMLTGDPAPAAPGPWRLDPAGGATSGTRELVAALTDPDPRARPASMPVVLRRMADLPAFGDGAGDPDAPVEVFDHVPALPVGWGPRGPATSVPPDVPAASVEPRVRWGWVVALVVLGVTLLAIALLLRG